MGERTRSENSYLYCWCERNHSRSKANEWICPSGFWQTIEVLYFTALSDIPASALDDRFNKFS